MNTTAALFSSCRLRRRFLVIALCLPSVALSQVGWYTILNPRPYGYGLAFVDGTTALCVGLAGTIHRSTDAGQQWSQVASGTVSYLRAVAASGTVAIAVGDYGTILRTTDGGLSWETRSSGTTHELYGVTFLSPSAAVAVGGSGTILLSGDGGLTWTPRTGVTRNELRAVAFMDNTTGVAVGGFLAGVIVRSTDGGSTWTEIATGVHDVLYGVSLSGGATGVAVGLNGTVLVTTDGGATWASRSTGYTGNLFAAHCGSPEIMTVGGGRILRSGDGGVSWVDQTPLAFSVVHCIVFYGPNLGLGAGPGGIHRTTTGGAIGWTHVPSGTSLTLRGVAYASSQVAVAVGDGGAVTRSSDGGNSWTLLPPLSYSRLTGVAFSTGAGVIVGEHGTILRTSDHGLTWSGQSGWTSATLQGVCFADSGVVVAVGDSGGLGVILRSTDAGLTWVSLSTSCPLVSVSFANPTHGVAVGSRNVFFNRRFKTTDGGHTWNDSTLGTPNPCGISMTPSGIGFVAARSYLLRTSDFGDTWTRNFQIASGEVLAVFAPEASVATSVGSAGIAYRTTEGGGTWERLPTHTQSNLLGVAFADPMNGLAVGQGGTILRTSTGGTVVTVTGEYPPLPRQAELDQNYPNPFNPSTTIRFSLPHRAYVHLAVYDPLGREVATLVAEEKAAGHHSVSWDAGSRATGVYFCRLSVEGRSATRKLLLLR